MRVVVRAWLACSCLLASLALPATAQPQRQILAILDVADSGNKLEGAERKQVNARYFIDRVRTEALRALPGMHVVTRDNLEVMLKAANTTQEECEGQCAVEIGKKISADFIVSTSLLRSGSRLKLSMLLYEVYLGRLLGGGVAQGRDVDELEADIPRAVAELTSKLREPKADTSPLSVGGRKQLSEVPALPGKLSGSVVDLDVDVDVFVLYDAALKADKVAKENPAGAADAWKKLAEAPGKNPYRDDAAARARQWGEYAEEQRKLAEQKQKDRAQLVKVLPLDAAPDALKETLLLHYARRYGAGDVEALLRLMPSERSRENAQAAVECELARKADRCETAAAVHEAAKDFRSAVGFHEKGCELGSGKSCERLGALLLGAEGVQKDARRAQLALQRACEAGVSAGCRRLARGLSDGSLGQPDAARVMELYSRACDLHDGESCASAGILVQASQPGVDGAGISWFRRACEYGQQDSCRRVHDYDDKIAQAKRERDRQEAERLAERTRLDDEAQRERERIAEVERQQRLAKEKEAEAIRSRRHVGWGIAIAGVALGGGATFFAMKGKSTNDDLAKGGLRTAADQQSILDQGKTYNTLTLVLGAGTLVGLAVGVPLILFNAESKEPRVTLAPAPAGLQLSWRWP